MKWLMMMLMMLLRLLLRVVVLLRCNVHKILPSKLWARPQTLGSIWVLIGRYRRGVLRLLWRLLWLVLLLLELMLLRLGTVVARVAAQNRSKGVVVHGCVVVGVVRAGYRWRGYIRGHVRALLRTWVRVHVSGAVCTRLFGLPGNETRE